MATASFHLWASGLILRPNTPTAPQDPVTGCAANRKVTQMRKQMSAICRIHMYLSEGCTNKDQSNEVVHFAAQVS